jgi:hypothetical protein
VLLPSGCLHGRILDAAALLRDAAAGRITLAGLRGRSTWPAGGQVAEAAVRTTIGELDDDALVVEPRDDGSWLVRHRDGRGWTVAVTSTEKGLSLDSCGKSPTPVRRWSAGTPVAVD